MSESLERNAPRIMENARGILSKKEERQQDAGAWAVKMTAVLKILRGYRQRTKARVRGDTIEFVLQKTI